MVRQSRRKNKKRETESTSSHFTEEFLQSSIFPGNDDIVIHDITDEVLIQSLWAGYGSVSSFSIRYNMDSSSNDGMKTMKMIVKRVEAPSMDDDDMNVSHNRKMKSYQVESSFYSLVVPNILLLQDADVIRKCALPKPYSIQSKPNFRFLMSDLTMHFSDTDCVLDRTKTESALKWLAAFHSVFWEMEEVLIPNDEESCICLWESGGYWHLKTRLDEYECIQNSRLKQCAFAVDNKLSDDNNIRFKTLCHGDFKNANLLFTRDGKQCAAVDFQYTGRGFGMKDVVMLIVSSVPSKILNTVGENGLLKLYYDELIQNLNRIGRVSKSRIEAFTFEKAVRSYELCLIDYVRFMDGWGYWGYNSSYARRRTDELLQDLIGSSGKRDVTDWQKLFDDKYSF